MKRAKAAQKLNENPSCARQLRGALLRPFEKAHDLRRARRRSPSVNGDNFVILSRHTQISSPIRLAGSTTEVA